MKNWKINIGLAIIGFFCLGIYWIDQIENKTKESQVPIIEQKEFCAMLADGYKVIVNVRFGNDSLDHCKFILEDLSKMKHNDLYDSVGHPIQTPKVDSLLKHIREHKLYWFSIGPAETQTNFIH